MQEMETENNKLFIAAYGLKDELSPEVSQAKSRSPAPMSERIWPRFSRTSWAA